MCGIAGAVGSIPDRLAKVRQLAESMVHRGPDELGELDDPDCSLSMRRLSIIDVQGGHQPIHNEAGDVFAVCNGELYNFRSLRPRLEGLGHRFATGSDVEVAVHAYEEWGDDFLSQINGMFALAIWDRRAKRLLLARDRLGKKPLYYTLTSRGLVFASELRTILALSGFRWTVDREACRAFCVLGYMPDDTTPIKEIRRLLPGHQAVWSANTFSQREYWRPGQALVPETAAEARSALLDLLKDAVALRLISEVPLGAFLSGGLDSSLVVALAAGVLGARIPTFSVSFPGYTDFDEGHHARQVARHFGTEHHEFAITPRDFSSIEEVVWLLDEPLADPAALPTLVLSRAARKSVTVVLTGEGADEVFGGYDRYALSMIGAALVSFVPGLRSMAGAGLALRGRRRLDDSAVSRLLRSAAQGTRDPTEWSRWLAVAPALASQGWSGPSDQTQGPGDVESGRLEALQRSDLRRSLANGLLTKVDRMTMAASVEARCPFLDYRVVEFGLSLPDHWKMRRLTSKVLLREVASSLLPREITGRRKHTFRVPLSDWLRGPLKGLVDRTCASPLLGTHQILALDQLRFIAGEHLAHRADYARALWAAITLHLWLEHATGLASLDLAA